jgi:PAS domain S-box-containing protein
MAGKEIERIRKMPAPASPRSLEARLRQAEAEIAALRRELAEARGNDPSFERFFLGNPHPMWIYDLRTLAFLEVNTAAVCKYGYSREEFLGMTIRDIRPPEDVPRLLENVSRVDSGFDEAGDWRHRKKDGSLIDVEINSHTLTYRGRAAELVLALDISRHKRAEITLQESRDILLNILDSIDATIYVADFESYEILFMNKPMRELFGGDFEGRKCWKVFRDESGPCRFCSNPLLLDAEGRPTGTHVWEGRNPITGKWYVNYDRAIKWLDGRWVRLQVANDVTRLKSLEEQRARSEELLRQSQKMEAIGTLAGGIAHDFNNILSAISGYTELSLLETGEDSPIRSHLSEVLRASQRAREMVRHILTFSRRSEPERKPIRAFSIVQDALRWLRASVPADIRIDSRIEQAGGIIVADATQIHQIIMNLCTNAIQAMNQKGDLLEVALCNIRIDGAAGQGQPELPPGAYVRLSVRDNGEGIRPQDLNRIFDPYFTTKEKDQGTGLGLAVVDGIVKSHGGAVTVESTLGQGTVFQVYLPAITQEPAEEYEGGRTLVGGNERILLVDDEQPLVEIGRQGLQRLGYRVEARTSSLEALELFRADPGRFDLVISDMAMPNMTGDKLARELMAIRPQCPVILCTGYSEKMSADRARAIGIRAFLLKPLLIETLAAAIRGALDAPPGDKA